MKFWTKSLSYLFLPVWTPSLLIMEARVNNHSGVFDSGSSSVGLELFSGVYFVNSFRLSCNNSWKVIGSEESEFLRELFADKLFIKAQLWWHSTVSDELSVNAIFSETTLSYKWIWTFLPISFTDFDKKFCTQMHLLTTLKIGLWSKTWPWPLKSKHLNKVGLSQVSAGQVTWPDQTYLIYSKRTQLIVN